MTPLEITTSAQPSSTGTLLEQALAELDVAEPERLGGGAGLGEHLRGHVDPDHLTVVADGLRRRRSSRTRRRTRSRPGARRAAAAARENGLPTPAKDSTARSGSAVDDLGRVAEQRGQRPAGVEVELPVGVQCHLPVLLPHVSAQRLRIDRDRVRHSALSLVQVDV